MKVKITTTVKQETEVEVEFPMFIKEGGSCVKIDSENRYTVAWVSPGKECASLNTWDQHAGSYLTAEQITEHDFLKQADEALTIIQRNYVHQMVEA